MPGQLVFPALFFLPMVFFLFGQNPRGQKRPKKVSPTFPKRPEKIESYSWKSRLEEMYPTYSFIPITSWWFQPLWNTSQNGNLPQIGVKIKDIWNHHLELHWFSYFFPRIESDNLLELLPGPHLLVPSHGEPQFFTYIWLMFMVNVGKYTIHGSYGVGKRW